MKLFLDYNKQEPLVCRTYAMRRGIAAMVTPFAVWAIELALPHYHGTNTLVLPSMWTVVVSVMCFVASLIAVMVCVRTLVRIWSKNASWYVWLVLGLGVALNAFVLILFALFYVEWSL